MKVGSVAVLGIVALYARPRLPAARGRVLAALLAIGVFDVLANTLYAVATTHGILPLIAVAGSLYAVVTVRSPASCSASDSLRRSGSSSSSRSSASD